jgi:uncharacterized protein (DUF1778 family)
MEQTTKQRSARLELRLTAHEKALLDDAAFRAGVSLSEWIRGTCSAAATAQRTAPGTAGDLSPQKR